MKVSVQCVDGSIFEYDDSIKELYRIKQTDGNVRLKLEGCPEVLITSKKPKSTRKHVVDAYLFITVDPSMLESKKQTLLTGLRKDFPYLDGYIVPVESRYVCGYQDESLLYDDEYNCMTYFLILSGSMTDQEVKYYKKNLVGGLTKSAIGGYFGDLMTHDVNDYKVPLVLDSACVLTNEHGYNMPFTAGSHKGMLVKVSKSLGLLCKEK